VFVNKSIRWRQLFSSVIVQLFDLSILGAGGDMKIRFVIGLSALLLVLGLAGFAETLHAANGAPADFEQRKAEQLRRLDQRLSRLRDERACVQAAASQDALKSCRQQLKAGKTQRDWL
jgi:hypothetical protein